MVMEGRHVAVVILLSDCQGSQHGGFLLTFTSYITVWSFIDPYAVYPEFGYGERDLP